jgi:hypothetical protein
MPATITAMNNAPPITNAARGANHQSSLFRNVVAPEFSEGVREQSLQIWTRKTINQPLPRTALIHWPSCHAGTVGPKRRSGIMPI